MTRSRPICRECEADRVRRWEESRRRNGLTEEEWPRPKAPEFRTRAELAVHRLRAHGIRR